MYSAPHSPSPYTSTGQLNADIVNRLTDGVLLVHTQLHISKEDSMASTNDRKQATKLDSQSGTDQNHNYEILPGSKRSMLAGARLLGPANANQLIEVTLKLRRKKELPDLQGPPEEAMSHDEFAATYGATQNDIDTVKTALGSFGLTEVNSNPAARSIRFSGTVAQMEAAFQVKLFNYAHESGNYRGRVGDVHVPSELKDIVVGVFGLDNRRVARRRRHPVRDAIRPRCVSPIPAGWYTPAKLATHYNFPAAQPIQNNGAGQTVGILEFGGGFFPQDLQEFCKQTQTAVPNVKAISTDGTATNAHDGAEGEVMLDVEVVAGVCPKASIVLYFADFTEQGWITALDSAVQDKQNNPGVISVSWGYAENADIWTNQAMTQVNEAMKAAAYLGVTICVAAGDDGSSDAITDGHAHVDFPSSSPYALAVGGTTVVSGAAGATDVVWKEGDGLRSDNGGSTGGGVSAMFARPAWQNTAAAYIKSVNPGAIDGRVVPDISANADWNASPYLLVVDGKAEPNGGTSAATPLIASLVTLMNQQRGAGHRIGYLTPLLYQAAAGGGAGQTVGSAGCTDVKTGDNTTDAIGGYSAAVGFDAVSGWGTPNGQKLAAALPAPAAVAVAAV